MFLPATPGFAGDMLVLVSFSFRRSLKEVVATIFKQHAFRGKFKDSLFHQSLRGFLFFSFFSRVTELKNFMIFCFNEKENRQREFFH